MRTPQEISPELFINTQVPVGYDFTAAYASDPVIPSEQYPVHPYPVYPEAGPVVPGQPQTLPSPATPSPSRPPRLNPIPQADPASAAMNAQLMNILAGVGVGSLAGMGLGYLMDGTEGAFAGGLVGAGVGGAVSPYLLAKIKAAQ